MGERPHPVPGVCVLHPDIKSSSRRGIYAYALSLIAGLRQAGHRTALATDLASEDIARDALAIPRAVAHPQARKVSAVAALPAYLRLQWANQPPALSHPMDKHLPLEASNAYLSEVDEFINQPDFYEICRLAGNKPLLPAVSLDFMARLGCKVAFTATPMAVKGTAVSVIQTVHDLIILNETVHDLNRSKFKRRLQACIRHADVIVAVSEYTRTEILQRYPQAAQRVVVAYQPLPADPLTVQHSTDPVRQAAVLQRFGLEAGRFIFFVGAVEERKNVARLIRAYQQSRASHDCQLVIAGSLDEGYAKAEGIDHLLKPGAKGPIQYIGRISDVDKLCLLRQARLFAFPSITEGFGLPALEAQSMGCPVLTSNTSALREVVAASAGLVNDPTDVDEITAVLDTLVLDDDLNTRLAREGLVNAQRLRHIVRMVS